MDFLALAQKVDGALLRSSDDNFRLKLCSNTLVDDVSLSMIGKLCE